MDIEEIQATITTAEALLEFAQENLDYGRGGEAAQAAALLAIAKAMLWQCERLDHKDQEDARIDEMDARLRRGKYRT